MDTTDRNLIILDQEEGYASHLMEYINRKKSFGMCAIAFTEEERFRAGCLDQSADILLCEETFADIAAQYGGNKTVFLLSPSASFKQNTRPTIFKYQSAEKLMSLLMQRDEFCSDFSPGDNTKAAALFGVCSFREAGSSGSYAYSLALKASREANVLLMTLDPFFSPTGLSGAALSELIYSIRQKTISSLSDEYLQKENSLDILCGFSHWGDATELEPSDLLVLLNLIKLSGKYCSVFIDFGGWYSSGMTLLEECDTVYVLTPVNPREERRRDEWMRQLTFSKKELLTQKLQPVEEPLTRQMVRNGGEWDYQKRGTAAIGVGTN